MSWISNLAQTYDQARKLDTDEINIPMPICHSIQNAHIEVVLDGEGNFIRDSCRVLDKTPTILPATEKSAGRSSGEAPHALGDKLHYLAADYSDYGGEKHNYYPGFIDQLTKWCESEYGHPCAQSVLTYLKKGRLVRDLVDAGIVHVDENGKLLRKWSDPDNDPPPLIKSLPKEAGKIEQGNALVRWVVEIPGRDNINTWSDRSLHESWINYEQQKPSISAMCYVTGEETSIAFSHPAKLRHSGDGAKLISSNDMAGYTFRGKFTDTKHSIEAHGYQAANVGSITSQKAHNALRWLLAKNDGLKNGDQRIISWARSAKPVPEFNCGTDKFALADIDVNEFDYVVSDELEETKSDISGEKRPDHCADLGQTFSRHLRNYMLSYRESLGAFETISIMAIDSATPGRMAMTYYNECSAQDYIERSIQWHEQHAWSQRRVKSYVDAKGKEKTYTAWIVGAPSPKVILETVYGDVLKSADSLKRNFYNRLLPCLIENTPLPSDFVRQSIANVCNPVAMEYWRWERALGVTCSIYRGFYLRNAKLNHFNPDPRNLHMPLNRNSTSRDYLYGRLLAVAEHIESIALRASDTNRPTTAYRLMQRFSSRPYSTWLTIHQQLNPYMRQLKTQRTKFLSNMERELDEIMALFDQQQFKQDTKLEGEFLLGFHCQRLTLNKKKPETSQTEKGDTQ